jgi:hypothetical protein
MDRKAIPGEIRLRIQEEGIHFGGVMPERVAIAWSGYLAALLEWGMLTPGEHQELMEMLPAVPDNPVIAIFLGRE